MNLKDIFKKKKPKETVEKKDQPVKSVEKKPEPAKSVEDKLQQKQVKRKSKVVVAESYRVLKAPQVTEKASNLVEGNQYVFKVWTGTNKIEVKKAVESIYGVDVLRVRIVNIPRKKRKRGKIEGFRKGYKKAIVRVKQGQKIDILSR